MSRSVDVVGETWAILIVRDAMVGIRRFEDFRSHLGISPTMLTQRLRHLVDAGVLERHRYQERPPRDEYVLTDRGRELASVLLALAGWGNDDRDASARPVTVIDVETGQEVDPVVIDRTTGEPIRWPRHRFGAGPVASDRVRRTLAGYDAALAAS